MESSKGLAMEGSLVIQKKKNVKNNWWDFN